MKQVIEDSMRKKILSILSAILITVLVTSTAGAGGTIKLGNVNFALGSLIATGNVTVAGFGKIDVTLVLDASGIPAITCTNHGSNDVPGQSSPKITASGQVTLPGDKPIWKNGKSPFDVTAEEPETIDWEAAGCPNSNWTARVDFVFWTNAVISVYDTATWTLLKQQKYVCTTTREPASVTCTPTK